MSYPTTSDGKRIVTVAKVPGNVDPYFTGAGDDVGVGDGPDHWFTSGDFDGNGDAQRIAKFNDWSYVVAGLVLFKGGDAGDYISMRVRAPATPVASNAGSGNCNLVAITGGNLIVPAAGDGSHDVALSGAGSFFLIPSFDSAGKPTGYWNWTTPDTGPGVISAGPPGASPYNLLDFQSPLVKWVNRHPLIGDHAIPFVPETKGRKMLPGWEFVVDAHRTGSLVVGWRLDCARKATM